MKRYRDSEKEKKKRRLLKRNWKEKSFRKVEEIESYWEREKETVSKIEKAR